MALTDPLGDMLTRIRNGQQARKDSILTPASKLRSHVLDVLQREGYIRGYTEEPVSGQKGLRIELKYFEVAHSRDTPSTGCWSVMPAPASVPFQPLGGSAWAR